MRKLWVLVALAVTGCSRCGDWNRHDSYRQCSAAIAAGSALTCDAMHLCANEAQLSASELKQLGAMVADAGCPPL